MTTSPDREAIRTSLQRQFGRAITVTDAMIDSVIAGLPGQPTKPYTFDVMSPMGYNDSPITVMAVDYDSAANLAARLIESERHERVLDVQDHIIVIPDE